jgi:hypothetical protein
MVDCIRMFNKKVYEDYVELSVGRAYFKPIINKILTKIEVLATQGNQLNNAIYYLLMEAEITVLSKRKRENLNIKDSNLLRDKVKDILLRDGIIAKQIKKPVSDDVNLFNNDDVEWFENTKRRGLAKLGGR